MLHIQYSYSKSTYTTQIPVRIKPMAVATHSKLSSRRHYNSNLFVSLLNHLSVTHPAEWRSDGCSLQPAGSCSLQETHIKRHQTCERSVAQTDCIFLSYLPCKLEVRKIKKKCSWLNRSRARGRLLCNISHVNSLKEWITLEFKDLMS